MMQGESFKISMQRSQVALGLIRFMGVKHIVHLIPGCFSFIPHLVQILRTTTFSPCLGLAHPAIGHFKVVAAFLIVHAHIQGPSSTGA